MPRIVVRTQTDFLFFDLYMMVLRLIEYSSLSWSSSAAFKKCFFFFKQSFSPLKWAYTGLIISKSSAKTQLCMLWIWHIWKQKKSHERDQK